MNPRKKIELYLQDSNMGMTKQGEITMMEMINCAFLAILNHTSKVLEEYVTEIFVCSFSENKCLLLKIYDNHYYQVISLDVLRMRHK